ERGQKGGYEGGYENACHRVLPPVTLFASRFQQLFHVSTLGSARRRRKFEGVARQRGVRRGGGDDVKQALCHRNGLRADFLALTHRHTQAHIRFEGFDLLQQGGLLVDPPGIEGRPGGNQQGASVRQCASLLRSAQAGGDDKDSLTIVAGAAFELKRAQIPRQ